MKYFIKTFGCQQNIADSERVDAAFKGRGFKKARGYRDANYVIINTCMVRESAENRVYGLTNNLLKLKEQKKQKNVYFKVIVTGCMVGVALRDKTGKYLNRLRSIMPAVDEFMPIEEVGFDSEPVRGNTKVGLVPISNGCNNFCTFCIVPFTRGREISRPYADIINECQRLKDAGYDEIMLLGQNVNSYGADIVLGADNIQVMRDIGKTYFVNEKTKTKNEKQQLKTKKFKINGKEIKPVYVKHLGRYRLPTLFPHLLEEIAQMNFKKVDFISANPWDYSDELIAVIARNSNITRLLHMPVQSGDNAVLKRMNRWYTREEYLAIIDKLKKAVPNIQFATDIIVGFPGETPQQFNNTVKLCEDVGFVKGYVSIYSPRPFTAATKTVMGNEIPHTIKRERWETLNTLINKKHPGLSPHKLVS